MKLGKGAAIALVFLATCTQQEQEQEPDTPTIAPSVKTIAKPPTSEVGGWQPVGTTNSPKARYLQAGAYDESRKVFVMFGGMLFDYMTYQGQASKETWEWSPATGKWTNRTGTGSSPEARSGAAMVYDSKRNKVIMFGGRSGSGLNLEDTWEWDPAAGTWTNVSSGGRYPSGRSQHVMVYEKSTGKVLLFGGGRTNKDYPDGTQVSVSLGDTWEYDPATNAWAQLTPTTSPSGRHDLGATWDSSRNKVVLFGGLQTELTGASGVPKQDTWEWDPAAATWTERTSAGNKPSQRYAHSMAFDSARGRALVFGGMDISTGGYLNDLWEWDPTSGAWSERTNPNATSWPSGRRYASMVAVDGSSRFEVVGGGVAYNPYGGVGGYVVFPPYYYGLSGSKEIWELDASTATFTDRTVPLDVPTRRCSHAMAYYPVTGKTYIFGGWDYWQGQPYDDMWEWDGSAWAKVANKISPQARGNAGLAYDPARKSLILYGGQPYQGTEGLNDTWEWTSTSGWTQLKTTASPDPLYGHGMVTDTVHNKILLFGGYSYQYYFYSPDGGVIGAPMKSPYRNEVWEWDGAKLAWANRTPTSSPQMPEARQWPILDFDETRQTLLLFDGYSYNWSTGGSSSSYWEWDTNTGGWATRDSGDKLDSAYNVLAVYDTIRRRHVFFTDTSTMSGGTNQTWELDVRGPTWYVRAQANGPETRQYAAMAFDPGRGVVVLFGGMLYSTGIASDETWEYKVSKWGNGTGCTSATAASCASGNCVDGVCCDSAACTGPCNSCNVAGSEGTCKPAKAGTVVPGSCENGQACDGSGKCLSANGQTCTSGSTCASTFCTDGVCCDTACTGPCVSCAQSGKAGKCTPYAVGSDPQSECGTGDGLCKSTCDGFGACGFPASGQPCSSCTVCDGAGRCSVYDPYCSYAGGAGGSFRGTGGYTTARGGAGGYAGGTGRGGSGGYAGSGGTGRGGSGGYAGSGGTTARGGSGGSAGSGGTTARGGSGGSGGSSVVGTGGTIVVSGTGGTIVVSGTGGAIPGSGGTPDASTKDGGGTANGIDGGEETANLRLRRSGCYCAVGSAAAEPSPGLSLPLLVVGAGLIWRMRRRRR